MEQQEIDYIKLKYIFLKVNELPYKSTKIENGLLWDGFVCYGKYSWFDFNKEIVKIGVASSYLDISFSEFATKTFKESFKEEIQKKFEGYKFEFSN